MKRFLVPTTAPAAMKKMVFTILCVALLMLVAAPAWADQCSGALPLTNPGPNPAPGPLTVTGCGALITVFAVDGNGNATAFTVSTPNNGNNNPYDGIEDSLIGIQNSSGAALHSIHLSASDTTNGGIFNFDFDGPCAFNGADCHGSTGYEGPDNYFTIDPGTSCAVFTTCFTSGTVNFTPIANSGSTWFALEGTPQSFGTISQTQTLEPGVTAIYPAGNDNSKWTPANTSHGGEQLTVTAVPIPQGSFVPPAPFGNESCVPAKDFTQANGGVHTCLGFQTSCVDANGSADCSTLPVTVMTNYDLPDDLPAIGGPDFLVFHGQNCPPSPTATAQSVFLEYGVNRFDPYTKGGSTPVSCYIATYTPGAPLITGAGTKVSTAQFVGFQTPVSDTDVNLIKAGSAVPLKWQVFDASGGAITDLTYCTSAQGTGCTGNWVNLSTFSIACVLDPTPVSPDVVAAGNSGLQNLGSGNYQFNWKTVKGSKGCVNIRATFSFGLVVTPAQLGFKYQ
ncbi:MAG: PxKF domain-containing protein [Terriglobales bacterium]